MEENNFRVNEKELFKDLNDSSDKLLFNKGDIHIGSQPLIPYTEIDPLKKEIIPAILSTRAFDKGPVKQTKVPSKSDPKKDSTKPKPLTQNKKAPAIKKGPVSNPPISKVPVEKAQEPKITGYKYIYLISQKKSKENQIIVGYTNNVKEEREKLQQGNINDFKCELIIECNKMNAEKMCNGLYKKYESKHINRNWYNLSVDDIHRISQDFINKEYKTITEGRAKLTKSELKKYV